MTLLDLVEQDRPRGTKRPSTSRISNRRAVSTLSPGCVGADTDSLDQAFELLRKLSQYSNMPLTQIATELVAEAQSKS
jgi:hypothetical protein